MIKYQPNESFVLSKYFSLVESTAVSENIQGLAGENALAGFCFHLCMTKRDDRGSPEVYVGVAVPATPVLGFPIAR